MLTSIATSRNDRKQSFPPLKVLLDIKAAPLSGHAAAAKPTGFPSAPNFPGFRGHLKEAVVNSSCAGASSGQTHP